MRPVEVCARRARAWLCVLCVASSNPANGTDTPVNYGRDVYRYIVIETPHTASTAYVEIVCALVRWRFQGGRWGMHGCGGLWGGLFCLCEAAAVSYEGGRGRGRVLGFGGGAKWGIRSEEGVPKRL